MTTPEAIAQVEDDLDKDELIASLRQVVAEQADEIERLRAEEERRE